MGSVDAPPCEATGVIICGGGPTGGLLSALLGQMEIPNVVLERAADITTDPRGIALDEDGIRLIQAIGMYDRIFTRIGSCESSIDTKLLRIAPTDRMRLLGYKFHFLSGAGHDLAKPPILTNDLTTSEGGTGHVGFVFHKQPELERAIRDAIAQFPSCEFRTGANLTSIEEDANGVTVGYVNRQGSQRRLRAPFLVGADGKTGYVRKKYLEPRGVVMERCEGTHYDETWVALNWHIRLPDPHTHADFPLWKLGYSPEQVYDLFFPKDFRFLCNPSRPSVCGRFGLPADRLWRFEFLVRKGEDPVKMATSENTSKIIYPYITHPGRRYGLSSPVRYPEDCITTLRSRPFSFLARSCNKWALGRVIIAGDAAHVFPPFGGQGIASGFRDASALAWRLAHLIREPHTDHVELLRGWYVERKQQFEHSLASTIRNGEFVTNGDPWKASLRDWMLWSVQLLPNWRRHLEKGSRADGMIRYRHEEGLPFVQGLGGGLNLPQVYAMDFATDQVVFTDDLIFAPFKKGLFQLLALVDNSDKIHAALQQIQGVADLTSSRVREDEATVLVHDLHAEYQNATPSQVQIARIASGEEFAADARLCRNRPVPRYYDPMRIRKEVGINTAFLVLRPDRFVYASCSNRKELWKSLEALAIALHIL
ncbi:hypothetical protein LTR35_017666 [Friedmanniomyces endolithicus]|uniref:FAD-binding domain-containing protein n=1 Tax=Friedmanniomyces endolithicus TaxID=329885 RepID=A0AAN6F3N8_9PEZI|nr:hypothetical protein LTR35_017666 [Friedmanniomyces endolithicus]KAK0268360.1 hypothetical protein LTS00_017593 [Friedmanniomyces endolithicus]KAK0302854.1 hypothetical protein LTR82_017732 [Friedmanniomyces endolithicus]KAK0971801.1 hypothetical protein LTR54_017711 [Friedmanniomyces endolithicus]